MSDPEENRQKALALAALALDLHVDYSGYQEHHTVNYGGKLVGLADSAVEALARAAEALGLEPDPAVQQPDQTRPALTEAQKESLLIVAEVASDLAIHADALTVGANSGPNARQLRSWCDELERPASLLATLFDLAPTESASDLPTPADLHRSISQARGLIQAAIGQTKDLDIPRCSKHLWEASRELGWAVQQITLALASTPDPQEGGKPDA